MVGTSPVPSDEIDDAFTAIARDGAGTIEVMIRLQKAFISMRSLEIPELDAAALRHSQQALARAEGALKMPYEIQTRTCSCRRVWRETEHQIRSAIPHLER